MLIKKEKAKRDTTYWLLCACLPFVFFLAPAQLLATENSAQVSKDKGLVVKSLYCGPEELEKLAPNVEQIHFVESGGRVKYYDIVLKDATKADYEALDIKVRKHCMPAGQEQSIVTEKETKAELYLPKEGTSKQLVRVNDHLILRSPRNESTSFSQLGKIGYSSKGGASEYYTSANIFIAIADT